MEEYYELSVSRLNGRLPPDLQEYITEAQWKTIGERHSSADARGNVKAGMIVCMTCCLTSCCYEVFSTYYKGQEIAKSESLHYFVLCILLC